MEREYTLSFTQFRIPIGSKIESLGSGPATASSSGVAKIVDSNRE